VIDPEPAKAAAPRPEGRPTTPSRFPSFWIVTALIVLLALLLKLPTIRFDHDNPDERIYLQLARNLAEGGPYSLQGSDLPPGLSPHMYDRPLFHHPPLFALLVAPFVRLGAEKAAIAVSWAGHLLALLGLSLIGRHFLTREEPAEGALSPSFWVPLLGLAVDPILFFSSRKLWMDNLLAGLLTMAMALFVLSGGGKERRRVVVLASVVWGLAALTKLTALFALPAVIFLVMTGGRAGRLRRLAAALAPAALLVLPWIVIFQIKTGSPLPTWVKPDDWLIHHYPFIQKMISRPWYYYLVRYSLLQPLLPLAAFFFLGSRACRRDPLARFAAIWFGSILSITTAVGASGVGYLMRHLSIGVAPVYLMALVILRRQGEKGRWPLFLFVLAIVIATVNASIFLFYPSADEAGSFLEMAGFLKSG